MDGKIYIIGYIGAPDEDYPEMQAIQLEDIITQVRRQPKATSFTCYIDSPGGEVEVGESIYKYIRSLNLPIKMVGANMVASIATVIFMAGDVRTVKEGCEFMIHLPMGGIQYATADEMEAHAKEVRLTENRMIKFYTEATGLGKEAITPLLKKETWLTPDQLKSFGFITGEAPLRLTASAKINTNPNNKKMAKDQKKKSLWARMEAALDKFDNIGKTKMLVLKSADQTDVDFYELEEGTDISVGAKARIDGADAEGDVTMADGRVVTFVAGEVTAITEADPEGAEEDAEMAKQLADALAENKALKADKANLSTEVATLKKEAKATAKVVAKIRKIQSKFAEDGEGKKTPGGAGKKKEKGSKAGTALANMRALSNKKKQ